MAVGHNDYMNQSHFVGLDIGTTSTKVRIYAASGAVIGAGSRNYQLIVPRPGWAEQRPDAIFSAFISTVQAAMSQAGISSGQIGAIGFSSVFHSVIAVDAAGQPLTNMITWADNRSSLQADRLKKSPAGHALYLRTGTPLHSMSPLTKLIWLREEAPEIFAKTAKFISIKEYVLYQLFGQYLVDHSIASGTGLLDLKRLTWDEEALSLAGVRPDQLSQLVPTRHILQGMDSAYAEAMGLAVDTPVVIGAGDGVLANLGVGAIGPGQFNVTIGTSSSVRTVIPAPKTDPKGRTYCYALTEAHWVAGTPSNSGGMMLRWFHDIFDFSEWSRRESQEADSYEAMIQAAMKIPPGAEGLLFLPFLSGERAPVWSAEARGVFFGLGLQHGRAHFTRAVIEGILLSVYNIHLALYDLVGPTEEARVSGGFTQSAAVQQMMADIFGYELLIPDVSEASSFGAALLAMFATGALADLSDSRQLIHIIARRHPNPELTPLYRELFQLFQKLYDNLRDEFAALAQLRKTRLTT